MKKQDTLKTQQNNKKKVHKKIRNVYVKII